MNTVHETPDTDRTRMATLPPDCGQVLFRMRGEQTEHDAGPAWHRLCDLADQIRLLDKADTVARGQKRGLTRAVKLGHKTAATGLFHEVKRL